MKTQFSFSKSGFTMIEIMVVIAIIGSMFALVSQINFRSQENMTKAERIANKIQGILHTSSVSVMM
ncbi:MAG: type II secretion system protein [Patescibacteria group bacterium]